MQRGNPIPTRDSSNRFIWEAFGLHQSRKPSGWHMVFSQMKNLPGSCFTKQTSTVAKASFESLEVPACCHRGCSAVGWHVLLMCQKNLSGISTYLNISGRFDYGKMGGASQLQHLGEGREPVKYLKEDSGWWKLTWRQRGNFCVLRLWLGVWRLPTRWQVKPWCGSFSKGGCSRATLPEDSTLEGMSRGSGVFRGHKPCVYGLAISLSFCWDLLLWCLALHETSRVTSSGPPWV